MKITDISRHTDKEQKEYRFGAYCRVSSDKDDQIHSFLAQLKYFREYAKNHEGYTLVDIYADEGITGTCMEKRDEFLRMIKDCKDGKINRIVAKSVSRFARNNEELLATIRELKNIGVSCYFEKENIDTDNMSSEFMVSLFGMQAQQESVNISENMRWSYQARMERGEFNTCKAPLGYKLEEGKLKIFEEEAVIIKRVFDLYLSGIGMQQIADFFNEEGVLKKHGFPRWHNRTIAYILNNERYMGDARLQKKYTTDTFPFKLKLNKGEKGQYYVENSNPAIISKEEFQAVQRLIKSKGPKGGKKTDSVFKGILLCPECNCAMRRMKNDRGYFWCCRNAVSKRSNCSLHIVYENELSRACERLQKKLFDNCDVLIGRTIDYLEQVITMNEDRREEIHHIDVEIKAATDRNHRLASLRVKNVISDEEFAKGKFEIMNTLSRLKSERKKLLAFDKNDESIDSLMLLKETIEKSLNQYDESVIRDTVDAIVVQDDGMLLFRMIGGLRFRERINV
ncbi:MAG: recombinase family protein [Saccharofermentans sp.]|nr:recombinase family protein [Saccharofermentans sp.]